MRCRRVRASTAEAETAVLSLQGDLIKVRQSYAEVVPSHLAGPDCRQLSFSARCWRRREDCRPRRSALWAASPAEVLGHHRSKLTRWPKTGTSGRRWQWQAEWKAQHQKVQVAVSNSKVEKGDDELAKEALTRRQTSVTKAWEPSLTLGLAA